MSGWEARTRSDDAPPSAAGPVERTLDNGLRVVVEARPDRIGASIELVVPVGAVHDPAETLGATTLAWEWQDRGAGGRSARARREAFAGLGVRHGGAAGRERSVVAASLLADALPAALPLLAEEVLDPTLDDAELETARTHALEALASLEDRPADLLDEALTRLAFLPPYDRSAYGDEAGLTRASAEAIRRHRAARVAPEGALLVIVGGADAAATLDLAASTLGGWRPASAPGDLRPSDDDDSAPDGAHHDAGPRWAPPGRHHVAHDAQQVQLGWAWPVLPAHDPRADAQALGLAVLAEGMGARLFREVREVRGLAYAVDAGTRAVRGAAWATAHAATTPAHAAAATEVVEAELLRLASGVTDDELDRARTLLRTREALRAESSGGRASQIVRDVLLLGRARPVAERLEALLRPTRDDVDAALAAAPCATPTHVALGPEDAA